MSSMIGGQRHTNREFNLSDRYKSVERIAVLLQGLYRTDNVSGTESDVDVIFENVLEGKVTLK